MRKTWTQPLIDKWNAELDANEQKVICYRCLHYYAIKSAPRSYSTKSGGTFKDPGCPKCNCKVYIS